MPKIARKTSHVPARRAIGVYDGPEPRPGNYPGVIKSASFLTYDSGTQALNFLVELESPDDSPNAQYNGFGAWTKIFIGEHEAQIAREAALYMAVAGKTDVDVVFDDKSEKKNPPITKIGGVSPVGKKVRVELQYDRREYPPGSGIHELVGDTIYPYTAPGAKAAAPAAAEDPDADLMATSAPAAEEVESNDPATEVTVEAAPKSADIGAEDVDYHSLSLPLLRAYAAEHGVNAKQPKSKILAELDAQGGAGESEFAPKSGKDLEALTVDQIKAWFDSTGKEEPGYFDEYGDEDKDDLIEEIVDGGHLPPF